MSELLDKQVNAQKEKIFQGSCKLLQAHEKCAMKMKVELEKRRAYKNVIREKKPFIMHKQKTVKKICTSFEEMIVDTMKVLFV